MALNRKDPTHWAQRFMPDTDLTTENSCHAFLTSQAEFSVDRHYQESGCVTVISCIT